MHRIINIIPFPQDRTKAARERQEKADIVERVKALPETLRELNVDWIFEEAARRERNAKSPV